MSNQTVPKEIEKIHQEILEEMNKSIEMPPWLEKLAEKLEKIAESIENIIKVIATLPPILLILLLIGIILLIVFLIIFIAKRVQRGTLNNKTLLRNKVEKSAADELSLSLPSNEIFIIAMTQAENGEYDKAILSLHRGSVNFLHQQKKLQNYRDYTNKEIVDQLDEEKIPFQTLALSAEKILFAYQVATQKDFLEMRNIYRENFYG